MINNKTKYTIYRDRLYILDYEAGKVEIMGDEILNYLRGIYEPDVLDFACTFGLDKKDDQSSEIG